MNEFDDATPPLDDRIEKVGEKDTETFSDKSKPSSKGSVYLMSLQKKN